MFDISSLFSIVLKHANKTTWSDRKKVSVGLSLVLHADSLAYLSDTTFNKLFTGQKKGRNQMLQNCVQACTVGKVHGNHS